MPTVVSSEDEAMRLSSNGHHFMSVMGPLCPQTLGMVTSILPVCENIQKIYFS